MAGVVEFNDELDRQVAWIADDEIEVLALNPVERLLADTPTHSGLDTDDIRQAHLAQDAELRADGLVKNGKAV